jgi:predicted O-linked N-acetylglucosamine transferase (SPINDLY family)
MYNSGPMQTPIEQALQTAVAHHQAGRLVEASQIYQQVLAVHPNHPDALHLLGLLSRRAGNGPMALSLLKQAVLINPNQAEYRNNLGITLLELGQVDDAIAQFEAAVRLAPTYAEAYSNLGSAQLRRNNAEAAAAAFAQAIHLRPNLFEPRLGFATALRDNGRLTESIAAFQQTIAIRPDVAQAHIELGHLLNRVGDTEAAIESYRRAVQVAPRHVDAFNSLGNALAALERFSEAEAVFRSALEIDPNSSAVWNNLGNLFRVQARDDEALAAYQRALAIDPNLGPAFSNLGNVLKDRGKIADAIVALRRAVELDPANPAIHSNLVYAACFDPNQDAQQILAEATRWADRHEAPLLAAHRPHDNDRDPDRKLRIGYVSADFRDHVIGRNVLPILEHHDRGAFEIHCFSSLAHHDAKTQEFKAAAHRWHECAMLSDRELAQKVRAEKIDILVDLTLHISGNRLIVFAEKPAPVQITWAGYPGTTGLRSIDYRITDPYVDPPGQTDANYSEKSIRMPHSFWCYRPMPAAPEVNPLPALSAGFVTFGCLNNSSKATEPALKLWSEVLRAVPGSRLVMLASEGSLRRDITGYFKHREIDPHRIGFVGPAKPDAHLHRFHLLDICLDPLPYTGHTTTLDALWMGVPVVTLSGHTSLARGSVTALTNVGLQDLIAVTPDQYIAIAMTLAANPAKLSHQRQTLRPRMHSSPLCNPQQFTTDLEAIYRQAWQTWAQNNLQPKPPEIKTGSGTVFISDEC